MDTVQTLQKRLGKRATITVELSLVINVIIKDVKSRYGRVDVLVTPVTGGGSGEKWVSSDRLTVAK